jgi:NADPH:quinone reductase-like Zn-dependent oxidoreductase
MVALRYLRDLASVRSGQRVLICGAAGAIGSASVQLARHMGADVTGVCSTGHLELVKGLGATTVIDRTTTDFTQGGLTYDVVLDTVGATSLARCRRALTPRGQFLAVLMRPTEFWQMATTSVTRGRRVRGTMVMENLADLEYLMGLAEAGHLRPVIDSTFPLEQIVEAHRRVDSGRKAGSVVVTMTSPTTA